MPVLLLAQGDLAAKDILKGAIQARYGTRPPMLETMRIDFRGRASMKIGEARQFMPIDVTALFRFPNAMRWDLVVRPPGGVARRLIESTDGHSFYLSPDGKAPRLVTNAQQQHSMVRRMWAFAAMMLSPMSEMYVRLTEIDQTHFKATHLRFSDSVYVKVDGLSRLAQVHTHCLNPHAMRQQAYTLSFAKQQALVDGLNLPTKLRVSWDKRPFMELRPYAVEQDIHIPDSIFRVSYEGNVIDTAQA